MNNYPPGFTPTAKEITYEYQCTNCGHYWSAVGILEFGIVNMVRNDADICLMCGCVGRKIKLNGGTKCCY